MSNETVQPEPPLRSPLSDSFSDPTMFSSKHHLPRSVAGDRFSATSDSSERSFLPFHQHNSSAGSTTFCSYESSPTTTYSTLDDSSATEPSPDSSPESPPPATFASGMDSRPQTADDEKRRAFFDLQRISPPAKKGRNLKNLAVNTSRSTGQAPSLTGLPIGLQRQDSAPSILSPAFVKPPDPQKRRPSNLGLTILTPSSINNTSPKQIRLAIPPTPGFDKPPTLRHFQSSPSLPLLNGLTHKTFVGVNGTTKGALDTISSPLDTSVAKPGIELIQDDDRNYDVPLSREEKPEAYPDGPICVYSPCIDLFLEPTAEQARQYDVVLNVASEVVNPFDGISAVSDTTEPQLRLDGGGGIQYAPARPLPAKHTEDEAHGSPTTPKATSQAAAFPDSRTVDARRKPEYIHIPWEHNSDIVPDLLRLCKLIDERVQERKRVLVHCQCGVSRSASLVVAYGLFKDPSLSVQEAYDAVKQRSKWIGPNMNLIMQLQEFRSSLARGGVLSGNRGLSPITPTSALSDWAGPFSARANEVGPHSDSLSVRYPAPPTSRSEHFDSSIKSPLSSTVEPWSVALPTRRTRAISGVRTSTYVDPAGHVLPVLNIIETPPAATTPVAQVQTQTQTQKPASNEQPKHEQTITSREEPTAAEFAMAPLTPPKAVEPADRFGLMSPTTTELTSNPFDRTALLAQMGLTTHTQEPVPTRSRSLRSPKPAEHRSDAGTGLSIPKKLHGKISSPSLREQHQLQHIQAQLEAQLPRRQPSTEIPSGLDSALMSPRATEFTQNPFSLAFETPAPLPTLQAAEDPMPSIDPRSPAQKGASPIIRNIEDFL